MGSFLKQIVVCSLGVCSLLFGITACERVDESEAASSSVVAHSASVTKMTEMTEMTEIGQVAPRFSLPGSDGQTHNLADYAGQHVVLAFFPKAFTGG